MLKRHWTVDDLADLPDDGQRYEVIDGELFVTPSPSARHQEAIAELSVLLRDYLSRERVGHAYFAPADVIFSPTRAVQPDLLVLPLVQRPPAGTVRRRRARCFLPSKCSRRAPLAPIVWPSARMFRDEGVAEYWIVDLDARTVERSTPADPRVEVLADRIEWFPAGAESPLVVDLVDYFTRVLDD